jgi:hypothetical protein
MSRVGGGFNVNMKIITKKIKLNYDLKRENQDIEK